jgi:hypothetical protein
VGAAAHLADAEGGHGGLVLEEVGDGVDEFSRDGVALERQLPLRRRSDGGRCHPLCASVDLTARRR